MDAGQIIPFPEPEIDPVSVKGILNHVARRIAEGEVESIAIAIAYKDGAISTCHSKSKSVGLLTGAVAHLQQRLCQDD